MLAEAELARIWFGWRVPLRPDTDTLLGRGLGLFAVALAAEAREGPPARRLEIVRLLAEYDRARAPGDDGSLLRPPEQSTPQQLAANALKAALFLADLDDLAGTEQVRANPSSACNWPSPAAGSRSLSMICAPRWNSAPEARWPTYSASGSIRSRRAATGFRERYLQSRGQACQPLGPARTPASSRSA